MAPNLLHLPNGQTVTVTPVFGGFNFKANDLNVHHAAFPPGWTIIIQSEDEDEDKDALNRDGPRDGFLALNHSEPHKHPVHRYRNPTLRGDNLFISSISNPSNNDFKPATSPTRQIAMMLWATLWWYFHQPEPNRHLVTGLDPNIPEAGRPKGEWCINVMREGIFKGRNLLQKLERMGLICSKDSYVGVETNDRSQEGWTDMFVSQRAFWQIDARIFLFTLSPTIHSPFPGQSPYPSRPSSPSRETGPSSRTDVAADMVNHGLRAISPSSSSLPGPFASGSHLPTYYPPHPVQFTFTNNIRHPIRPKPPRQGEPFYTRYIPSVGQYLSFRVASLSHKPPTHHGPVSNPVPNFLPPGSGVTTDNLASIANMNIQLSDTDLLNTWMNDPRVSAAWGIAGPRRTQEAFLESCLSNKHSFPVMGCWDGKPFGFFEIYWVKEDQLARYIADNETGNWDRGFHVLVGEQEFRGAHRVRVWLSALIHYCWLADFRTAGVMVEPRCDNEKFINYLYDVGFHKDREIAFPYKQAALMKISREAWESPAT